MAVEVTAEAEVEAEAEAEAEAEVEVEAEGTAEAEAGTAEADEDEATLASSTTMGSLVVSLNRLPNRPNRLPNLDHQPACGACTGACGVVFAVDVSESVPWRPEASCTPAALDTFQVAWAVAAAFSAAW